MNVGPYNIILEGFNLGIVCVLVNKLQPVKEVYEFSFKETPIAGVALHNLGVQMNPLTFPPKKKNYI